MDELNKKYWTEDDELIEKYVLGRISAEEKKRLDEEIADCELCKEKLRMEMEITAGIRRHGRDMLKALLRKKLHRERASQFYSYQYIGLAAAVVIIAIGIGLYQIWFSDLVAPKKFHEQQIVLTPREDTSETINEIQPTDDRVIESERLTDQSSSGSREERSIPRQQENEIAGGESVEQPSQSASGAVSSLQQQQAPAAAIAEADELTDATSSTQGSSSIWLMGKVVMIPEPAEIRTNRAAEMEISKKSERSMAKEKSSDAVHLQKAIVSRRARNEKIVLKQRALKDLPLDRLQQRVWQSRDVETLLERSDDGVILTLFDDSVEESELQEAVVETFTDDSLVVSFSRQRIAFHLPSGWNTSPNRRR